MKCTWLGTISSPCSRAADAAQDSYTSRKRERERAKRERATHRGVGVAVEREAATDLLRVPSEDGDSQEGGSASEEWGGEHSGGAGSRASGPSLGTEAG